MKAHGKNGRITYNRKLVATYEQNGLNLFCNFLPKVDWIRNRDFTRQPSLSEMTFYVECEARRKSYIDYISSVKEFTKQDLIDQGFDVTNVLVSCQHEIICMCEAKIWEYKTNPSIYKYLRQ